MKSQYLMLALFCGAALTVGAVDTSKIPPAASKKVSFEADIKPLVEKSCLQCHSGEKPKAKYKMDTVENINKGGSSGDAAVIPGNSAKSPIVHYVAGLIEDSEMPPIDKRDKYPAFTNDQIGLLRAWIDQGAKP